MKLPMIVGCLLLIFVVVTGAAANGGATQSDRENSERTDVVYLINGNNTRSDHRSITTARFYDLKRGRFCGAALPAPFQRNHFKVVAYANTAVVIGGANNQVRDVFGLVLLNVATGAVTQFDPEQNRYVELAPLAHRRYQHQAATVNDVDIVVTSGQWEKEPIPSVRETEVYQGGKWTTLPQGPRMDTFDDAETFAAGSTLWRFGGQGSTQYASDGDYQQWRDGPLLTAARLRLAQQGAVFVAGHLYLCGGYSFQIQRATGACVRLALTANGKPQPDASWTDDVAPMLLPRAEHTLLAYDGKMLAVGGVQWSEEEPKMNEARKWAPISTIEIYDPTVNKWSILAEPPAPLDGDTSNGGGAALLRNVPVSVMNCSK